MCGSPRLSKNWANANTDSRAWKNQGDPSTGALHLVPQFPAITGGQGRHTHDSSGFKMQLLKAQSFSVSKLSTSHPRTELFIATFSPSGPTQPPVYQKVSHVLFKFHFPKEDSPGPSAHHDPYFITASARTALDTPFTVPAWMCIFFFVKLYTSKEVINAQLSSQSPARFPVSTQLINKNLLVSWLIVGE